MCGLFGVTSSVLSSQEVDRVVLLGYMSASRGINSTGALMLGKDPKSGDTTFILEKRLTNSVSFFTNRDVQKEFSRLKQDFLLMGHTRLSTIGVESLDNAHPISHDNIVLCHNGTIETFVKDKKSATSSDSVEFARRLNHSVLDALHQADRGHYAVSFVNYRNSTLNFARNPHRPLWLMWQQGRGTMYWASERWMLVALREKDLGVNYEQPVFLPEYELWSFRLGSCSYSTQEVKKFVVHVKPSSGKFPSSKHVPMAFCATCKRGTAYCKCPKTLMIEDKSKQKYLYKGWQGALFPIHMVMPKIKKGCSICKNVKDQRPSKSVFWFSEECYLCDECNSTDAVVKEHIHSKNVSTYKSELVRLHDGTARRM